MIFSDFHFETRETGHVELTVFDILGKRFRQVVDAPHS